MTTILKPSGEGIFHGPKVESRKAMPKAVVNAGNPPVVRRISINGTTIEGDEENVAWIVSMMMMK